MSCCGTKIEARRNGDLRITYTPSSRKFSFAGLQPTMTIRLDDVTLLTIAMTPTINGSVWSIVGDSMVVTILRADIAVLDSATPDTAQELLSYDIVVLDQTGLNDWLLGGPFVVLGLNDASCGTDCGDVEVSLSGQCVSVSIEGGNVGAASAVSLAELNQAVQEAEDAATDSEAAAAQAIAARDSTITGLSSKASKNGSDITDPSDWRTALSLGDAATLDIGTALGTVAAGDDARFDAAAQRAANLSDLSDTSAALANIGGAKDDLSNVLSTILGAATISSASLTYAQSLIDVSLGSGVMVEWFGAVGDSVTDDTAAIQAAIDYVAALPGNKAGGVVLFGSACYRASNLIIKSRVRLRGMGYGVTQIRRTDTGTGSLLFIPKSATLFGWDNICFDGNSTIASGSGHGIEFEVTNATSGQSFSPFGDKVTQAEYSYKMASCWSFAVGHCRKTGVYINGYDFDVRFHDYRVSHCLEHGIYNSSTDSIFSLGYIEKNGWSGFHNVVGATKIYGLKSIFNCRQLATPGLYANIWIGAGQGIETAMLEAQDGYGDGIYLNCSDSIIIASSNQNGYKAPTQEGESSRIHTNLRVGSAARRLVVDMSDFAYKATVGTDGFWTTEWPYVLDTAATFSRFNVDYQPGRFNQLPPEARAFAFNNTMGVIGARSSGGANTFFDISPKSVDGTGAKTVRFFRETEATNTTVIDIHGAGTSTLRHRISGNASQPTQFNIDGGSFNIGGASAGTWNTTHLVMGPFHFWVEATKLYMKNGAPTSGTDGTVVGSQT